MTIFGLFLILHIISGTLCLFVGLAAAFMKKEHGWHTFLGEYIMALMLLFLFPQSLHQ